MLILTGANIRLVLPDGRHQVGDAGFRPTLRTTANHFLFLSQLSRGRLPGVFLTGPPDRAPRDVDWVSGAALLVRADVIRAVGPLDDSIFLYGEDVEWGCRMRDHGVRIHYLPDLEILHLQGTSAKQSSETARSVLWLHNLRAPTWLRARCAGMALRRGPVGLALRRGSTRPGGHPRRSRATGRWKCAASAAWVGRRPRAGQ
jgi:GT2 family glycosyltransferase